MGASGAKLLSDQAYCLWMLGRQTEALARYEEAHRLDPSGEEAIGVASLLVEADLVPAAETWLRKAIQKAPELLPEIERDPAFRAIVARASWRQARNPPLARLEEGWGARDEE